MGIGGVAPHIHSLCNSCMLMIIFIPSCCTSMERGLGRHKVVGSVGSIINLNAV